MVLAYDNLFADNFRLKAKSYYQLISGVPVSDNAATFSMLNSGADFETPNIDSLENKGSGKNYGLELTIEKFYSQGYYFLVTGSLFESNTKSAIILKEIQFSMAIMYLMLLAERNLK